MATRFEVTVKADPMLKNELLEGAKGVAFAKGTPAQRLRRALAFVFRVKTEDEKWKDTGIWMARQALAHGHTPVVTPCTVTWIHLRKNGGRVDTAAIAMPTWSFLDGIVRGGMLPDDDKRYVVRQSYEVDERAGYEGIRVVVETCPDVLVQDELE